MFAVSTGAQGPDPQEAARTVVANEEKFMQLAQEQGTRAAFLEFLADDGIVFQPAPMNGKDVWRKRPEKGISLSWKPLFVAVARSADLAYTTGPSEWKREKKDAKPAGYGQFISIWRKQKAGGWKVALDVGSEVPGPTKSDDAPELEISVGPEQTPKPAEIAPAHRRLAEAENAFATAAKADSTIALSEFSAANVRVQREGVFPAVGKDPARLMLSVRRGKLALEKVGGAVSAAGDLAYSYGRYTLAKVQETERGHYLQIWRTEADGTWKIVLDYQARLATDQLK